jgi:hypothetical protein
MSAGSEKWMGAMHEEIESLEKKHTWEVVRLPSSKNIVNCKWIFKSKEGMTPQEPTRYKAKLVGKGFSQFQEFITLMSILMLSSIVQCVLFLVLLLYMII